MDIVARAKNMLMTPKTEWAVIADEPAEVGAIYKEYILLLAAIPPVCQFLGLLVLWHYLGFGAGLGGAILQYVFSLIGVYVIAFIAARLGPSFSGRDNIVQAVKLVAYGATARWVGGVFLLIPVLGWLLYLLMALYSLYLLYLGTVPVMGVPSDRAVPYTVAIIVIVVLVSLFIGLVDMTLFGGSMMGMH
jgi:hypothetical protein